MMGWFSGNTLEIEPQEPTPVRLASDEFLSGLKMIAAIYERREKNAREYIINIADRLSRQDNFNFGDLDRALDEIRAAVLSADRNRGLASEIRDWSRDYEYRGARPPYMPAPPPTPEKPYQGGE